jgi:hypothetical protein
VLDVRLRIISLRGGRSAGPCRFFRIWYDRNSRAALHFEAGRKAMNTVWEIRMLPEGSPTDQERRKSFSGRIEALKEYDRVMHSGSAWVELWELEEGKEPKRLEGTDDGQWAGRVRGGQPLEIFCSIAGSGQRLKGSQLAYRVRSTPNDRTKCCGPDS